MKKIYIIVIIILIKLTASAQVLTSYEEFRSLSRANIDVFKRMVSAKGFQQIDRTNFMNNKTKEVLIKDKYGLKLVLKSATKLDNILNSFKKNGFKFVASFKDENPFEGYGETSFTFNYFKDNSRILEGKLTPYGDKTILYFICFYNL
jgi:hypothetical protein